MVFTHISHLSGTFLLSGPGFIKDPVSPHINNIIKIVVADLGRALIAV